MNSVFFLMPKSKLMYNNMRKLQAYAKLMDKLEIVLQIALKIQNLTAESGTIFLNASEFVCTEVEDKMFDLATIHQDAFYGRVCAFQFCDSLRLPMIGCAVAFSACHETYSKYYRTRQRYYQTLGESKTSIASVETNYNYSMRIGEFFKSILSGKKYATSADLRSKKMASIVKTTEIDFCKAFWQLTETSIVQVGIKIDFLFFY